MPTPVDRHLIFECVRHYCARGLSGAEVTGIDAAISRIERSCSAGTAPPLGVISEQYESGGRGPGTVSGGKGDPGGVSYGSYQLASRTGTVSAFLREEGARWAGELSASPGSPDFSTAWQGIAKRDGPAFGRAQHEFIERTHYRPVISAVRKETGHDLDLRPEALRNAVWSAAVQHGAAARLLCAAVAAADRTAQRGTQDHDRAFLEESYRQRADHVQAIAAKSAPSIRRTLMNVMESRYPQELAATLAMLLFLG